MKFMPAAMERDQTSADSSVRNRDFGSNSPIFSECWVKKIEVCPKIASF
jgi:hypothetical protein